MSKDKQSIQVTIRVRPLSDKQKQQDNRICVNVEQHTHSMQTFYGNQTKKFTFDSICDNNTQEDLFQKVGKRSTAYCLEGYNCTIFAYGQTGSGKTFTMMGVDPAHDQYQELRGLIPRTLEYLFESIDLEIKQTSAEYIIRCSFLEIYNEQIIDLLNSKNNSNLQIREDIKKGVYVEGISEQTIFKGEEALQILKKGSRGRHVGSTCYNQTSSRSHSVFTMQIQSKHTKSGVVNTKIRYFHFIDLAGSQRTKQINGQRLKQGCSINKSLHVLGKVINSLAESTESKPRHVNYRDSKLTFLLKDSLGGNSKTHLIANISPCTMSYSQSNMTLAFARRVKLIKVNKALINQDMSGNLQNLKSQIKRLKQEIIMLRNGNINTGIISNLDSNQPLNEISTFSPLKNQNTDSNMIAMLNQYVSEQLDKQTKFQLQINKLNKKVECLQSGIKKFSENQINLKMIIAIYDDKVSRLKKAESLLEVKMGQLNSQSLNCQAEDSSKIMEYFNVQRDQLRHQISNYKKIVSQNSNVLLKFLKSCKAYQSQSLKQSEEKSQFANLVKENTSFLSELKKTVEAFNIDHVYSSQFGQSRSVDQILEQKMSFLQLQYSKKQTQFLQRIEQLQLQINESKNLNQDNEILLKESVNKEICLEQQIKTKEDRLQQLANLVEEVTQRQQSLIQKVNKVEQSQKGRNVQILKLRSQLQLKSDEIKDLNLQLINDKQVVLSLQSNLTQSKNQNLTLKQKVKELEKSFKDSHQNYEQKIHDLQAQLKTQRESERLLKEQITQIKSANKAQQIYFEENISQKQKQLDETKNLINRVEHQLSKQDREIVSNSQKKAKLQEKLKVSLQKIIKLSEEADSYQQSSQKMSLTLVHSKHEIQEKSTKIAHLQAKVKEMQEAQNSTILKWQSKEQELLQIINQMENSSNLNHQEINKIRIQSIHLKQAKSDLQTKSNRLIEKIKELEAEVQTKKIKMEERQTELQQRDRKNVTLKQQLARKKQQIRQLQYRVEETRSQVIKNNSILAEKDQQFEETHSKYILLSQQISQMKRDLNTSKLQNKELQTKLFCQQKTFQIEKESLVKQNEKKITKISLAIQEKASQAKKYEKMLEELMLKTSAHEQQIVHLKQINSQNDQLFKVTLEKQLSLKLDQICSLKQSFVALQEKYTKQKSELVQKMQIIEVSSKEIERKLQSLVTNEQKLNGQLKRVCKLLEQRTKECIQLEQKTVQIEETTVRKLQDLQIEHNEQIDSKNEQIQMKNQEIQKQNEQIKTKNEEINTKTELINSKISQLQHIKREMRQNTMKIHKLSEEHKMINELAESLTVQLAQSKIKHEQVSKEMNDEIAQLSSQIERQKRQFSEIMSRNGEIRDEVQKQQQIINNLQSSLLLKQQIQQKNFSERQNEKNQQIKILNQNLKSIQKQLQNKQVEFKSLSEQYVSLQDLKNQLEEQNQNMDLEIIQLTCKLDKTTNEKANLIDQQAKIIEENRQISGKGQQLAKEILVLSEKVEQKQNLIFSSNQQLYQVQKCLAQQKNKIVVSSKQLATQKMIIESKQEEIRQLNQSIQESQKQIYTLQNQLKLLAHQKLVLQQKQAEIIAHNEKLQSTLEQLNTQLNQFNINIQDVHSENHKLALKNDQLQQQKRHLQSMQNSIREQIQSKLLDEKKALNQQLNHLQQLTKSQKNKIEQYELLIKQKQSNLLALTQINQQKEQLMESYKSLQQINKGLGHKCEDLLNSLQEQKTEYRKLETKYLGQKNINQNLKQLIENSEQQKRHLSLELNEKNEVYHKLLEKISKNESIHGQKKSEHYLKTVDLLQKSRHEQLELRKINEELKKQMVLRTQQIQKKQRQIKQISLKNVQHSKTIEQFEHNYIDLQSKYELLLDKKKFQQKMEQQNFNLKQQFQQTRPKLSRMTLKIQELEERIRSLNQQYIEIQNENHDLKKKILYPGTTEEKTAMYINKLKSEINDLKKEKLILEETIKKQTHQKMKLKTQMLKNTSDLSEKHQNEQIRSELDKRLNELSYLQEIIAEMICILKIKKFQHGENPKSIKIESIRKAIVTSVRQKIQQNLFLKDKIQQLQAKFNMKQNKQNKSISSIVYNGVGSQSAKKQGSNQKVQRSEKRQKSFSMREEELTNLIRNKMSQQFSQQKRDKKGLTIGGTDVRQSVDNDESMPMGRQRMKVKDIITNSIKANRNAQ